MRTFAIDLGGTTAKAGIVDSNGDILYKTKASSAVWKTPAAVVKGLAALVTELKKQGGSVEGVGLGMPGPLSPKQGIVIFTPNMPFKKPFPIQKELEKATKLKVRIQNDANCAMLGEATWGAAQGASVALMLTLGTGVGGGATINGKIFDGAFGLGTEFGHILVDSSSKQKCGGGHYGCLESLIGEKHIIALTKKLVGKPLSPKETEALARGGNKKARAVYETVGKHLGVAASTLLKSFNPDVFLVGGGISPSFDLFEAAMKKEMKRQTFPVMAEQTHFARATLGNDAGLLGAAQLMFE
jgi:glucokinase